MRRTLVGACAAVITAALAPLLVIGGATPALAVDNGLAKTPPMGWNDWNAFGCNVNEQLVEQTADFFVSSGMKDAGYTYVNIDDCWALPDRDTSGSLVPDPIKFPHGIAAVADYVHARGLELGIYTDAGVHTCNKAGGFPGALGHEVQDAATFASWGVDYLKYDNCNNNGLPAQPRYTTMRDALAATDRPIVYSICNWGQEQPWTWGPQTGNLWRTTGDIKDSYASMLSIFHQNVGLAPSAGPGGWNDPDMLEIGNGGMSDTEYRAEFSLWAAMAAPLIAGTDLRKATPATLAIYLNKEVIAVDQDRLGAQGTEIASAGGHDVLVKPLANGDRAVVLFNETDTPAAFSTTAAALGLPRSLAYSVRDLWSHSTTGSAGTITAGLPAHGVAMYRVSPTRRLDLPPHTAFAMTGLAGNQSAGQVSTVTATYTNDGLLPAPLVGLDLTGPAEWAVLSTSRKRFPLVGSGKTVQATFQVTAPAVPSAPFDTATFTGTSSSRWGLDVLRSSIDTTVSIVSPVQAPYRTFTSTTGLFAQVGDSLAIRGSGKDTYGSTDQYSATYLPGAAGATSTVTVRVTSQSNTSDWAKAGIMLRNDITRAGASPGYAILMVTPGHGYALQWDGDGNGTLDHNSAPSNQGTGTAAYPSWLKLVRTGDTVTGYYSIDDQATWNLVGTATLPNIAATQDVGVFMTAHNSGATGEADFRGLAVN